MFFRFLLKFCLNFILIRFIGVLFYISMKKNLFLRKRLR